jgi:hypothetical protein
MRSNAVPVDHLFRIEGVRGSNPHWADVDLDTATVHVHREPQRVGGRLLISETKTLDSDAGLPLPELCVTGLRDHRTASPPVPVSSS